MIILVQDGRRGILQDPPLNPTEIVKIHVIAAELGGSVLDRVHTHELHMVHRVSCIS